MGEGVAGFGGGGPLLEGTVGTTKLLEVLIEEGNDASVLTALGSAGWKNGLGVVPVNGLKRLRGASGSGCRSLFPVGRIRRLGKPEGVNSSSPSSSTLFVLSN